MKHILLFSLLLVTGTLHGQSTISTLLGDWQQRMEEHKEDGLWRDREVSPIALVAVSQGETKASSKVINQTIGMASRIFPRNLMVCEVCLNPEMQPGSGLYYRYGQVSLEDVRNAYRDIERKPIAALWVSYNKGMLSYRIVSLETGHVIYSENIHENMDWNGRSIRNFSKSRMAERVGRHEAIYHHQWDLGLYPGFHLGYSFLNQWGQHNDYLSGLTMSVAGPLLGLGVAFFKVIDSPAHPLVGVKLMVNLPEAAGSALSNESSGGEALVGQFIAKYPFPGNMGGLLGIGLINTDGTVALGVSW